MRADPLGPPIYWVVPRQSTFALERLLTCGSGLGAFTRCRVVSFEQLAEEVLVSSPGVSRVVVSRLGRLATIAHLIRASAEKLSHFKSSATTPGLAAELMDLLDELSRNGSMTAGDDGMDALDRAAEHVVGQANEQALAGKLADLRLLRDEYRKFMGPERFDKDARMEHVLRHAGSTPNFQGATFYFDGFLDFLDFERRMIAGLCATAESTGGSVEITFTLPAETESLDKLDVVLDDPRKPQKIQPQLDDASVFYRIEMAHRQLRLLLRAEQIPVRVERLKSIHRFATPALAAMEREFVSSTGERGERKVPGQGVEFVTAPDRRSEVDAVARRIKELTRGPGGMRLREIVVLVRRLGDYEEHLGASFAEHGIAHFLDQRRDATAHPLPRLVRAVLSLGVTGWNSAGVVAACKSGLVAGCSIELACRMENWATAGGISGRVWTMNHPKAPPEIEAVRGKIVAPLQGWIDLLGAESPAGAPSLTVRDACTGLLSLLEALGVRASLSEWAAAAEAAGDTELQSEHTRVWAEFAGFLEELVDLLGDVPTTPADLQWLMAAVFAELDLGMTPTTVDQVIVGEAERTRVGEARAVFVLGLSDGQFPAAQVDAAVLSERERNTLRGIRVGVDPGAEQRQLDEQLIAYLAFSRASELLVLSRPTTDGRGSPAEPSPYWLRAMERVTDPVVTEVAGGDDPKEIATPRQLVQSLLRWARRGELRGSAMYRALYAQLAAAPAESDIGRIRTAAWPSLQPRADRIKLPSELAKVLFPLPLELTDRQVESFAKCPFRHLMEFGLGVAEVRPPVLDGGRVSGILHRVLREFTEVLVRRYSADWAGMPQAEVDQEIVKLADDAVKREVTRLTWDGSAEVSRLSPRDRFAVSRVVGTLAEVVASHRQAAGRTTFVPRSAGVKFGEGQKLSALELNLPSGGKAMLSGSIDRIDVADTGAMAAWDYTLNSANPPNLAWWYHGLQVRLLIHLLVLRREADVGGGLGLPLSRAPRSFKTIKEWRDSGTVESEQFLLERRLARGVLNLASVTDFDMGVNPGEKSQIVAYGRNKTTGEVSRSGSDVLTPEAMEVLLARATATLEQIAGRISEGVADVSPFKMGTTSACTTCAYKPACRFNPREGSVYVHLVPGNKREVLKVLQPEDESEGDE